MNIKHIIIGLSVLVLFILYLKNRSEHAGSLSNTVCNTKNTSQTNDAIQNMTSTYNTQNITLSDLHITGQLTLDNNIIFKKLIGIIVAWSGAIENIPPGWGLCDGSTYTTSLGTSIVSPDLRSKFILGASKLNTPTTNNSVGPTGQPSYTDSSGNPYYLTPQQVNKSGGEEIHTVTVDEMASHNHSINITMDNSESGPNPSIYFNTKFYEDNPILSPLASYGPASNVYNTGESYPHNNMPPYYTLAYIIKL
jgi:microcystin-dependent protein